MSKKKYPSNNIKSWASFAKQNDKSKKESRNNNWTYGGPLDDKNMANKPAVPATIDVHMVSFIFKSKEAERSLHLFAEGMDTMVSPYHLETALIDMEGMVGFGVRLTIAADMLITMLSTLSDHLEIHGKALVLNDMEVSTGKATVMRLP